MSSELSILAKLISAEVESLESGNEVPLPPLNDDTVPAVYNDPNFVKSAQTILNAASRLIAAIQNPYLAVQEASTGMYVSAVLNVIVEANVTEALKEAGSQGLHVRDLAQRVNMDPIKLGRCMRYLSSRHIFRETSPDAFANNRLSMALDTGKAFEEVKDRSPHRYDNSTGVAAFVGHTTDDLLNGASFLPNFLLDPTDSTPLGLTKAPIVQAAGFDGNFFEWLEQPGNEKRLHRFETAMKNMGKLLPHDLVLAGFDWYSLPKGSLVVDVGAGVGAVTLPLARSFPEFRFVVQDRPQVVVDGERFWKIEFPDALSSGLVKLQAHSFFEPQPIKGAAVFMLRHVLHDWSDSEANKILRHLRTAATPSTKLLILDQIVPYTCPPQGLRSHKQTPGFAEEGLPDVLQGNPGPFSGLAFMLDMQMMNVCNSRERTIGQWDELVTGAGWKMDSVRRGPMCSIICTPN